MVRVMKQRSRRQQHLQLAPHGQTRSTALLKCLVTTEQRIVIVIVMSGRDIRIPRGTNDSGYQRWRYQRRRDPYNGAIYCARCEKFSLPMTIFERMPRTTRSEKPRSLLTRCARKTTII